MINIQARILSSMMSGAPTTPADGERRQQSPGAKPEPGSGPPKRSPSYPQEVMQATPEKLEHSGQGHGKSRGRAAAKARGNGRGRGRGGKGRSAQEPCAEKGEAEKGEG